MDKTLHQLIEANIKETFGKVISSKKKEEKVAETQKVDTKPNIVEKVVEKVKTVINETITVFSPKTFILKTSRLSEKTKHGHIKLYKEHGEALNKIEFKLEGVNRETSNANDSTYRSLKMDEVENKNSVLLHELYFGNIADPISEVTIDSLPFMRLARDFGTFENWQFDFIAACVGSRDGWAITYYDTCTNTYKNCIVDGDSLGLPVGAVPVIVMDMHLHSYYYDYLTEKKLYIIAMLKELNWPLVEARMIVAEKSNLQDIFRLMPQQSMQAEKMLSNLPPESQDKFDAIPADKTIDNPRDPSVVASDQDQSTTPKEITM